MRIGLNLPTTYGTAPALLAEIAALGYDVARVDVPPSGPCEEFVSDYVGSALVPLFLLHDIARNEPLLDAALPQLGQRFAVQIYNEPPGLDKVNLTEYIAGIQAVYRDCRARGFTGDILMGGLANPSRDNRDWLRSAIAEMPPDILVDEHRYSYKTQDDWSRPWKGYKSRSHEANSLKQIAGTRAVTLTESGWHTAEEQIGFPDSNPPRRIRLTDEQCRDNLVKDFELYAKCGYEIVCVYQLNDGPNDTAKERYGIRNFDGSWKPQTEAVKLWKDAGGQ